jgi:hypothetical protein
VKPARIELHIEELVLHGFVPGERHAIGAAVERELGRLLAQRGPGSPSIARGERAHVNAGDVHVAPASKAPAVGAQVAQAVYGGLTR